MFRDPNTMLSGDNLRKVYAMVEKVYSHGNEVDCVSASRLFLSVFEHCRGRADEFVKV